MRQASATVHATLRSHLDLLPTLQVAEAVYDVGTAEHCSRVGYLCGAISRTLGLAARDIEVMNWVGILHDLGKLAVSTEVLRKTGPLTKSDWAEVKRHPVVGADLVLSISPSLAPLAAAIRAHHERWNGSGYPDGLDRVGIPLFGRIAAIGDVFDAVTHLRIYRTGVLTHREGVEFVVERANRDFDPELVNIFLDLDRRGLIVADHSTPTDKTTPAVLRAEANPVVAPPD